MRNPVSSAIPGFCGGTCEAASAPWDRPQKPGFEEKTGFLNNLSGYALSHLPAHLAECGRWDDLAAVLFDPSFLETKAESGFVLRDAEPGASTALAVSAVVPKSPAERGGLEAGDVILQVNELAVVTREAMREALADAGLEAPLRLIVRRGGNRLSLVLKAPGA